MSAPIPSSKPRASLEIVTQAARLAWSHSPAGIGTSLPETFVYMSRAYYDASMGKPGNDVGMYDDAAFIVAPGHFSAWNANTDPSRYGWNPGAGKYMARLKSGVYRYRRLKHKMNSPSGYMAFGQGDKAVTVERIKENGSVSMTETGCFGINLHRGGNTGTSSEGCMTIPTGQWLAFDATLAGILKSLGTADFWLILADGPII